MPIPSDDAGKNEVISAIVANVDAMIKADRKITALKELQVIKPNVADFFYLLNSYFLILLTIIYAGSYMANWLCD